MTTATSPRARAYRAERLLQEPIRTPNGRLRYDHRPKRRRAKPGEAQTWLADFLKAFDAGEVDVDICVLWPFGVNSKGYPCIGRDGVSVLVTRVIVEHLIEGPLRDDEQVCHDCDTPRCVNPGCFFRGSNGDNTRDKVSKGRQARGEGNGRARLTAGDVRDIRASATGQRGEVVALAKRYRVSHATIGDILTGVTWASVA